MSRFRTTRLQFVLLSGLAVTTVLASGHAATLRWEQTVMQEEIQKYLEIEDQYKNVVWQLGCYRTQVRELQRQLGALEEILDNRARTYLFVCGDSPVSKTLLSRAGGLPPGPLPAGVKMPLRSDSGFTAADFEKVWQTCRATRLQGLGEILLRAEKEYGLNALALAAIVVHESHWGRSVIARDKNNLAGLGAFDGNPYTSAMTFATREDSICFLANLLARDYIAPEGRHYHGPDLAGIGINYASDPAWAWKVASIMETLAGLMVDNPETLFDYAFRGAVPD